MNLIIWLIPCCRWPAKCMHCHTRGIPRNYSALGIIRNFQPFFTASQLFIHTSKITKFQSYRNFPSAPVLNLQQSMTYPYTYCMYSWMWFIDCSCIKPQPVNCYIQASRSPIKPHWANHNFHCGIDQVLYPWYIVCTKWCIALQENYRANYIMQVCL